MLLVLLAKTSNMIVVINELQSHLQL